MARTGLCLTLVLAGCGLASKDFEIDQPFPAGGAPSFSGTISSAQLTGPLSADVSKIHSITLTAARIEATDNNGDISFINDAKISISSSQPLANALLASLSSPPPAGATSVQLQVTGTELKPYIQSNGNLGASISYSPIPATVRSLRLVLTIHGALL